MLEWWIVVPSSVKQELTFIVLFVSVADILESSVAVLKCDLDGKNLKLEKPEWQV